MSKEVGYLNLRSVGVILLGVLAPGCKSDGLPAPSAERAEAVNQALKNSLELPTVSPNSVALRLMRAEYGDIETEYGRLFDNYQKDVLHESPFQKAYDLFFPGNNVMLRYIDAWVEATKSEIAYSARGYYKMAQAGSARGNDVISKVPEESLLAMHQYCIEATDDFRLALEKNPKLTPAWLGLVRIAMMADMPFSPGSVFEEAIGNDQRSQYLRQQYMKSLEPRWGGSYEAMAAFAERCAKDIDLNPRFWSLSGAIYADMGNIYAMNGDHRRAAEMYSQALLFGDKLDWLQYRSNALSKCGEYDKALSDVERILFYSPGHEAAPAMASKIKQMQARNE